MTPINLVLGQNIRAVRVARRLTATAVCKRLRMSPGYLYAVEKRGHIPNFIIGIRLAQLFGVRPESFLTKAEADS